MQNVILVIDGENFLHKIKEVLKYKRISKEKVDLSTIDVNKLLKLPLKQLSITRKILYFSKLQVYEETRTKSEELIKFQRKLRNSLVKQGFEFILAGNVRPQNVDGKIVFREKGVDVKIAVDLVSLACDGKINTAILCSSDSDLQPAVSELKKRNVEVIYLGFELNPNRGLSYTTARTILLRNSEILEVLSKGK